MELRCRLKCWINFLILILFGGFMNVTAQDLNSDFTKYNLNDISIMVPEKLKIRHDYKFEKATNDGKLEEISITREEFGETVTPLVFIKDYKNKLEKIYPTGLKFGKIISVETNFIKANMISIKVKNSNTQEEEGFFYFGCFRWKESIIKITFTSESEKEEVFRRILSSIKELSETPKDGSGYRRFVVGDYSLGLEKGFEIIGGYEFKINDYSEDYAVHLEISKQEFNPKYEVGILSDISKQRIKTKPIKIEKNKNLISETLTEINVFENNKFKEKYWVYRGKYELSSRGMIYIFLCISNIFL
jgi:predicted Fe-S protein YdhL (DUF1289 family)